MEEDQQLIMIFACSTYILIFMILGVSNISV